MWRWRSNVEGREISVVLVVEKDPTTAVLASQFEENDLPENEKHFFHGEVRGGTGTELGDHREERHAEILASFETAFRMRQFNTEKINQDLVVLANFTPI